MSDNSFDDMVCKMREYLKGLGKCKPFTPDKHCNMRRNGRPLPETKGVYCFYEGDKALYIGRTRNIRKGSCNIADCAVATTARLLPSTSPRKILRKIIRVKN